MSMSVEKTDPPAIARVLTPPGRGAVATIRVEGDLFAIDSYFRAANQNSIAEQPLNRICYGTWKSEDLVVVRISELVAEIHCHGGAVAVNRILSDLETSGVVTKSIVDLEAISFENEITQLLQLATTRRTAHALLKQRGLFPQAIERLENVPPSEAIAQIESMLEWAEFGSHLTLPWKVVLCGPPNVGKSSLINALVGYSRTVVYDQPGTTRDVVSVETAFEGWPIEFSDTAGLRETPDQIEAIGVQKAKDQIQQSDLVVIVCDATIGAMEQNELFHIPHPKTISAWNKSDLPSATPTPPDAISISALTPFGVEELARRIIKQLVPKVPTIDQAFPVSKRQIDFLRSKLNELRS